MPPSAAPVVISFSVEGVQALRGIFDSVESRMIQFDRTTSRSQSTGSRERVSGTRREVDQREKEYQKLVKEAAKWETQAIRDASKASAEKVKLAEAEARRKDGIRENSMRMAHRLLEQEVRDEARAAEQKIAVQQRAETSMRRRYGRAAGRGVLSGLGNMFGGAASLVGMGLAVGGGFAVADATRKEMSFSRSVAQASNMSYIPGTTTRAEVAPAVIAGMSKGIQGLTNIDKEQVASGIKRYVGLSSDFKGLSEKTKTGRTGLEELSILSKASGTSFETFMESAAAIKANNQGMNAEGLVGTMRMLLGAGKQGTIPLDQLAPSVGMIQSSASRFSGDQTKNQANLLGLVQLAGRATGGDAARAAMSVKDFTGDIAREGLKHGMSARDIYTGGNEKKGFLSPEELLGNVFKASGGGFNKAQSILGQRSMPLFDALKPIFDQAESVKAGSGVEAVKGAVRGFENFGYSPEDTMTEFAEVMKTDGERIDKAFKHIEETIEGHVAPFLDKFATVLEENEPAIDKFLGALAEAAEYMISHPWMTLFAAVEANILNSIAKAAIGQTIKEAINAQAMGLGGAVGAGGGGGKFLGSGGVVGALGAAMTIGVLAVTTATIGIATIDLMMNKKAHEQSDNAILLANTGQVTERIRKGTATPEEIEKAKALQGKLTTAIQNNSGVTTASVLGSMSGWKGQAVGALGASLPFGIGGLVQGAFGIAGAVGSAPADREKKDTESLVTATKELTTVMRGFSPQAPPSAGGGTGFNGGKGPLRPQHDSPARSDYSGKPSRGGQ